ncbi:MAG: hypothetical protein ACLUE1_08225 [Adlercreutzia equolifaciens]
MARLRDAGFVTTALAGRRRAFHHDTRLKAADKRPSYWPEGDGLAASTIAACDWMRRIPMHHGVDS